METDYPETANNINTKDVEDCTIASSMCQMKTDSFEALKSARLGFEYAFKVRLAHCLVICLLYNRTKPISFSLKFLLSSSREHAIKLGLFAFLYQFLLLRSSRIIGVPRFPELQGSATESICEGCPRLTNLGAMKTPLRGLATFISGFIAGFTVWGHKKSSISYQVCLYILARAVSGCSAFLTKDLVMNTGRNYRIFAGFIWGIIMFLYETDPTQIQSSLRFSMDFMYRNKFVPMKFLDFVPFAPGREDK